MAVDNWSRNQEPLSCYEISIITENRHWNVHRFGESNLHLYITFLYEELHNLYSSTNRVTIIKSQRMSSYKRSGIEKFVQKYWLESLKYTTFRFHKKWIIS